MFASPPRDRLALMTSPTNIIASIITLGGWGGNLRGPYSLSLRRLSPLAVAYLVSPAPLPLPPSRLPPHLQVAAAYHVPITMIRDKQAAWMGNVRADNCTVAALGPAPMSALRSVAGGLVVL